MQPNNDQRTPLLLDQLKLGQPSGAEWPDYVAQFGLTEADVPALQALMLDEGLNLGDPESEEVWVPLHAWRALSQLPADNKFEAFYDLLLLAVENDDDWGKSDFNRLMASCGPDVIHDLKHKLETLDLTYDSPEALIIIETLGYIGNSLPEIRDQAVAILAHHLLSYKEQNRTINGFLVMSLMKLGVREMYPLIEAAYMDNKLDHLCVGTLSDIQHEFDISAPPPVPDAPTKRNILDIVEIDERIDLSQKRTVFVRSLGMNEVSKLMNVSCPACGERMLSSDMVYLVFATSRPGGATRNDVLVLVNDAGHYCLACPAVVINQDAFEEQFKEASDLPGYGIAGVLDVFQIDNRDKDKPFFELEELPVVEFLQEGMPEALSEKKKSYVRKRRLKKRR
ncbi:MAG: hypothetical protein KDD89_03965 [Anaerolineales bacterium]|nr:hypothetical protein [Anaerolineales bacterium]